jgi:predicted nucleic acid-binding protein
MQFGQMIGFDSVFVDSVAFIYLVENHPTYYDKVAEFIGQEVQKKNPLVTSVITVSEFCVKPFQENDNTVLLDFRNTLEELNVKVVEIGWKIAEDSSKLRAKYKFLKTADALQIASAISLNCKGFFTNDIQLQNISEIKIVLIQDL